MTAFTFRTTPLYARLIDVVADETLRAIDNNAKGNGGDLVAAIEAHERRLEALIAQYEGYRGAKAAAEAAGYRSKLDLLRTVDRSEPKEDGPISAGYVAFVCEAGGLPVVLAYESSERVARRSAIKEAEAVCIDVDADSIQIQRVECYDDRSDIDERQAVLFGRDYSPVGEIAMPYGFGRA